MWWFCWSCICSFRRTNNDSHPTNRIKKKTRRSELVEAATTVSWQQIPSLASVTDMWYTLEDWIPAVHDRFVQYIPKMRWLNHDMHGRGRWNEGDRRINRVLSANHFLEERLIIIRGVFFRMDGSCLTQLSETVNIKTKNAVFIDSYAKVYSIGQRAKTQWNKGSGLLYVIVIENNRFLVEIAIFVPARCCCQKERLYKLRVMCPSAKAFHAINVPV